jgi:MFS family permease
VAEKRLFARLPATVWALGFVSLFMDTSSELIHSLLPLFLSTTLGASMEAIGLIEGIAEGLAQFSKLVSGALSDRMASRKPWMLAGYGLSALTKPLFPLAGSVALVASARFLDRIGKGLRDSPRDALMADATPQAMRGAAYGLRQGLDTTGAVLGPLAAAGLLMLYANEIRPALWWAVFPAMLCVATLALFVREPEKRAKPAAKDRPGFRGLKMLPSAFWLVTAIAAVLTLARFSDAFLVLRARSLGVGLAQAPFVFVLMNIVYALFSYPAGALSDRLGRRGMLAAGVFALIGADIALSFAQAPLLLWTGVALWGLHMGLTQGLLSAMVADAAPGNLRGTAFGVFYAASGVALLLASPIAGILWDRFGPATPFAAGAVLAALVLLLLPSVARG